MSVEKWDAARVTSLIAVPDDNSDKYSRGVLGVATGSVRYPGAAVLGVEAAVRAGVGMVRYMGPREVTIGVLARRPEVVSTSINQPDQVQAWLAGSGIEEAGVRSSEDDNRLRRVLSEVGKGLPLVADAGALDLVSWVIPDAPVVITPHAGELERMFSYRTMMNPPTRQQIRDDAGEWALYAANLFGVTVMLKGATTHVATPGGIHHEVKLGTPWLATAGSGDVLGGILGALLATHSDSLGSRDHERLAELAAGAAALHGLAARAAAMPLTLRAATSPLALRAALADSFSSANASSPGGNLSPVRGTPIVALDIVEILPTVIATLLED